MTFYQWKREKKTALGEEKSSVITEVEGTQDSLE